MRTETRRVTKAREAELRVEVRDFGPISSGQIKLKPLTLFIGPNNSGKSYAAMLVHSLYESYASGTPRLMPYSEDFGLSLEFLDMRVLGKELGELRKQIEDWGEADELQLSGRTVGEITHRICAEIYEKRLGEELIRSFASPLGELVRIGTNTFALTVSFNSQDIALTYRDGKLRIGQYPSMGISIRAAKESALGGPWPRVRVQADGTFLIEAPIPTGGKREKRYSVDAIMDLIFYQLCTGELLPKMARPCYYLPAARSGILQGHKALAASIVRQAPYVGIKKLEIPPLSGVVSDLVSSVLLLPKQRGSFYDLAREFEEALIKGEIVVKAVEEPVYPEIRYSFKDTEIPLHRASSTVSELVPLFLYLKYLIGPDSVLMIEEPEAHLHPENQRILAHYLVKLVRKGVSIVITTHSEYLLEQLSNFLLLSKVDAPKRRERFQYDQEDYLSPNEVAVHLFGDPDSSGGYRITPVAITEDGISQEEFIKIHEALYEETFRLHRELDVKMEA